MDQDIRQAQGSKPSRALRVLLVRPPAPNLLSFTKILDNEPLELEYLATALMARGHEPYFHDGLIDPKGYEQKLQEVKPHIVAITGYITQEILMGTYCSLAKGVDFGAPYTILGGVHVQLNYQRLAQADVDFMCRSEDVWAFADLVDALGQDLARGEIAEGREDSEGEVLLDAQLRKINGLVYKDKGEGQVVNPLVPIPINSLPIPDRTFFHANKHHYRYLDLAPVATIKTAFSCPHTCNFCYCTRLAGGRYDTRNMDLVLDEIETIDPSVGAIQIVDDDFMVDPQRVEAFLDGLEARGIQKTFVCYARADRIAENPQLVTRMSALGFRYFLVGLEAIDTQTLDQYHKKTTADVNRRCAEILGPLAPASYLIGLMILSYDARPQDFEGLYKWVVAHGVHHITVSIFTPIPGTPLYEDYKDKITSTDIRDWDFLHLVLEPTHMSRAAFYRAYYKLVLRLYRIAKRTGMYGFMDLAYYRTMLGSFLKRQFS